VVERVAQVADQFPELAELDLNPVVVGERDAVVVDAKARLVPGSRGPGDLFRALHHRA
jgi:hypothetical protein